jgi:hypothetical protein
MEQRHFSQCRKGARDEMIAPEKRRSIIGLSADRPEFGWLSELIIRCDPMIDKSGLPTGGSTASDHNRLQGWVEVCRSDEFTP